MVAVVCPAGIVSGLAVTLPSEGLPPEVNGTVVKNGDALDKVTATLKFFPICSGVPKETEGSKVLERGLLRMDRNATSVPGGMFRSRSPSPSSGSCRRSLHVPA